jgi:hypothetical protein
MVPRAMLHLLPPTRRRIPRRRLPKQLFSISLLAVLSNFFQHPTITYQSDQLEAIHREDTQHQVGGHYGVSQQHDAQPFISYLLPPPCNGLNIPFAGHDERSADEEDGHYGDVELGSASDAESTSAKVDTMISGAEPAAPFDGGDQGNGDGELSVSPSAASNDNQATKSVRGSQPMPAPDDGDQDTGDAEPNDPHSTASNNNQPTTQVPEMESWRASYNRPRNMHSEFVPTHMPVRPSPDDLDDYDYFPMELAVNELDSTVRQSDARMKDLLNADTTLRRIRDVKRNISNSYLPGQDVLQYTLNALVMDRQLEVIAPSGTDPNMPWRQHFDEAARLICIAHPPNNSSKSLNTSVLSCLALPQSYRLTDSNRFNVAVSDFSARSADVQDVDQSVGTSPALALTQEIAAGNEAHPIVGTQTDALTRRGVSTQTDVELATATGHRSALTNPGNIIVTGHSPED